MMRTWSRLVAVLATLVVATSLPAATSSTPLHVSAEVPSNCIIAVSDLAFGAYDPLATNATQQLDASANVRMMCTRSSRATITIDIGRNAIGNIRALSGGGTQHVAYRLYRDSGRTQEWGGGAEGLQFVSEGTHKPQQLIVYGRIPPGQEVASGVYTDVVTATVDF